MCVSDTLPYFIDGGFCNAETLDGGPRGVFRWNETVVGTTVTTSCFYGPPEVRVARVCVSRQNLTAPSIESCRTFISAQYSTLNNVSGDNKSKNKLCDI